MRRSSLTGLFDDLPAWLYELLPAVYAGTGVAAFLRLEHWLGMASGALLVGTAVHVGVLRWQARRRPRRRRGNREAALLGMTWLRAYEFDIREIDAEHRELFSLSHELLEALVTGRGSQADELIDALASGIQEHFRNEEAVMEDLDPQLARSHFRTHRRLEAALATLTDRYRKGRVARKTVAHFLLNDIVRQHMLREDTNFAGLQPAVAQPRAA